MAAVPQRTLNWLWSVLTKDHHDPNQTYHDAKRTYNDVASALAQYPSLAPRTDVYTFENGFSALLLRIVGTLPASFRGTVYKFPISVWVPNSYPADPPFVYVVPTPDMLVRPGQHVSLEGRVYHHYLAHWAEAWDKSSLVDLLSILREIFAKEPPVRYIQQQQQQQQQQPGLSQAQIRPPPLPPLPPELGGSPSPSPQSSVSTPPRPPPKPGPAPTDSLPSLPPLPPKSQEPQRPSFQAAGEYPRARYAPQRTSSLGLAAALPLQASPASTLPPHRHMPVPVAPLGSPPRESLHQQQQQLQLQLQQQLPEQQHQPQQQLQHQRQWSQQLPLRQAPAAGPPIVQTDQPRAALQARPVSTQAAAQPATRPPADLLTSPFDLELPSITPSGPAPPIPPNPEKDALLRAVSGTIAKTLQSNVSQSKSAAQSLLSQSQSLHAAMATLQAEMASLNDLRTTLQSNISILQQCLQRADGVVADVQARMSASASASGSSASAASARPDGSSREGLPPIDELLVAPTVVGKQLYDLVAEERGIQQAIYALQAALVKGVIGVDSWSRHTRGLAREAFLKRALARKIGRGMGLDESA